MALKGVIVEWRVLTVILSIKYLPPELQYTHMYLPWMGTIVCFNLYYLIQCTHIQLRLFHLHVVHACLGY